MSSPPAPVSSSQPHRDTQISVSAQCSRKLEPSLVRSYDEIGTVDVVSIAVPCPVLSYVSPTWSSIYLSQIPDIS